MKPVFSTAFLLLLLGAAARLHAQQQEWTIEARDPGGTVSYDLKTGIATGTNGIIVKYGQAVLIADTVLADERIREVIADGHVRIQRDDMVWAGEHIRYNFNTGQAEAEQFRTGKPPFFAGGQGLAGDTTNHVYTATNGFITVDDYFEPALTVRARRLVIRPGERIEAHGATLCVGGVPVFYVPFYTQRLDATKSAFMLTPGYRSRYGGFLFGSYAWKWNEAIENTLHLDYRTKRGVGAGLDMNLHLRQWGEASVEYYYLHDDKPESGLDGNPFPHNRQRVEFSWLGGPFTNTTFKSRVSYESDAGVRREFFEREYRQNVQPSSFVEARHFWDNFSLDVIAQPRVNDFLESVERLPQVKLTAFRQQIGPLPFYYESESSAGYYRRLFAETNGPTTLGYEAARADTLHQIVLPTTLFGWLNFTPRAGGRFTYYGQADGPGADTKEIHRSVFNTGAELSFKASRTWAEARNGLFELDGLRHIVEPSANYVYVPRPDTRPNELPQFDYELPSLRLLPIEFPDYNAIDSVDSQNVIRLGLRNRLQTKRDGQIQNFLTWDVYSDWRLRPEGNQSSFSDLFSDFTFRPRSWLMFESMTRYDMDRRQCRMTFNSLTLQPNTVWSWRLGYFFLRDDPATWGTGNDLITSTVYLRLNENWGVRASHYIDAQTHTLAEQVYSLYRDMRSWTGALSFRDRKLAGGGDDFTVLFTFSIKALPRLGLGEDTVRTESLISY